MSAERFAQYTDALGIEPLDPASPARIYRDFFGRRAQAIKKVLMDQRVLAGVGNIYANEALWRAGIDPSRAADRVVDAEASARFATPSSACSPSRSRTAARAFATTATRAAARADFVERLAAYGRAGEPCLRCGHRLIGTHAIDGRTTVLCAHCQK